MTDTIYALASAQGRSGVAVMRVSGPDAWQGLTQLTSKASFEPRKSYLATLRHPVSHETLDQALVIAFKSPQSFTGEDVVEYHVHGGPAVINAMLGALSGLTGYRLAQPGEFTRRAFLNGKMDLTEAEAVADLIHAETQLQKNQALMQMEGGLFSLYESWAEELKRILAYIEADLEFPDEDLPEGILPQMKPKVEALIKIIDDHLNDNRRGERLRDGIHIAIIGAPNAGKSSLINVLAQREVAIVSPLAGTTRDIIEAHLDIGGYPVIIADTAGLRPEELNESGHDAIESEGVRRALRRAQEADIRIILYDGTQGTLDPHSFALEGQENSIPVINKVDENIALVHPADPIRISAKGQSGIDVLLEEILKKIKHLYGVLDAPTITRARHRDALQICRDALMRSLGAPYPELSAEDLRLAVRGLGRITGRVDVEDLLDVIFRDFCIGK